MGQSRNLFQKLYAFVRDYLKSISQTTPQRGRPQKYGDEWILTLWLYQTLQQTSYRKVLEEAKRAGFPTPTLSTYHYHVSKLPPETLQELLAQAKRVLASQNS